VADSNPCLRKKPTASGDSQFSSAHSAPEDAGDGCIEESCIRKAVTERGLIGDPVGLSDTTSIHRELEVRLADGEFLWEGVTSHGRFPRSRDSVSNTRPIIIDVLARPRRSQWG